MTESPNIKFDGDPASIERDLEEQFGDSLMDFPEWIEDDYEDMCDIHEQLGC